MDETIRDRFEGRLLGYRYRQKVVQETRAQYQQVVLQIEQDSTIALTGETVIWPTPKALCYPVFKETSDISIVKPPIIFESNKLPNSDMTSPDSLYSVSVGSMEERQVLPKDKDSLLELRSKLGMELVWLRQAISSRQKYLQVKEELQASS